MLTATSTIDAINVILSSIGYAPINDLNEDIDIDVSNALRLLDKCSRDIQRKGWDFNTSDIVYNPDLVSNRILWDKSLIRWASSDSKTYVKRGDYFYNATDGTFTFTDKITLSAVIAVDFDDLPDCFKNYVTARAALAFQARYMGDSNLSNDLQIEASEAYQDIVSYDMNMGNYNMLQLPGVSEILTR